MKKLCNFVYAKDTTVQLPFEESAPFIRFLHVLCDLGSLLGVDLVITSGNDGQHKHGSLHYKWLAWDVRCKFFRPDVKQQLIGIMRDMLGKDWDVLHEYQGTINEHIHAEYDPKEKQGETKNSIA